jgi:hypothetical protein
MVAIDPFQRGGSQNEETFDMRISTSQRRDELTVLEETSTIVKESLGSR